MQHQSHQDQLADLHQQAEKFCGPVELEEPTEEDMASVRKFVTREQREAETRRDRSAL